MTAYIISIEGQRIPVDAAIGKDDDLVRKTLTPIYPQVATASITRTTEGETEIIQVVKKAGSKGVLPAVATLDECACGMNPAVALLQEMNAMREQAASLAVLLSMDDRIQKAIADGKKQADALDKARSRLDRSQPQPAPEVPWGF